MYGDRMKKLRNTNKSIHMILLLFVSILILSCDLCNSNGHETFPEELTEQLDAAIDSIMTAQNLPGVIVQVRASEKEEYLRSFGVCNIETEEQRDPSDPFRIASITKTFTGLVIHILISEGKLSTSDKLSQFFPDFPNADNITVRNLLRMRSGIADYADAAFLAILYADPFAVFTTQELIQMSADKVDQFYAPDSITVYTNVNYTLLGEIAAQIENSDIGTVITEKVIEPLGLSNTLYPATTALTGNTRGYCWEDSSNAFADYTILNPLWAGAAGAIISTLDDLSTFVRALYKGDLVSDSVNAAMLEAIQFYGAPDFLKYGEGILEFGSFWGHNGTIFGFSSEMYYLPEEDATIIINVNRLDLDDHSKSTDIFLQVTKILFPDYVNW